MRRTGCGRMLPHGSCCNTSFVSVHRSRRCSSKPYGPRRNERKHKSIKQAASQIYNTESFERSVLARVLLEQTRSLKTNVATFRPGLRETTMQALPRGSEGVWRCKRRRQPQPQMRRDAHREGRLGYVRGHVGASRALPGCRWRIGVAGPRVRCRCWPDFALAGAGCHILHLLEPVAPRSRAARVVLDL